MNSWQSWQVRNSAVISGRWSIRPNSITSGTTSSTPTALHWRRRGDLARRKTSVTTGAENSAGTGEPRATTIRARVHPDGGAVFRRQLRSLRIDPLGIVGLVGLVILWWLLTFVLPGHDLPAPR